ncbi:MAG: sucrase ferredoxin [Nitriliruptoraceae bacterium]
MTSTTCSALAREQREPLAGTATQALGYLLIEQPGSWGRDALTESGLDATLGARLAAAAKRAGVKVLLTRRPGPHPRVAADRLEVVLAHVGPTPWMEACQLTEAQLAALDPACCAQATPPGLGTRVAGSRWLVCTHARRDRCCATRGRPIADTLGTLHPEQTWETSHLGGHRFAGTMLVLPHGLVYGNLDVAAAVEVVTAHLAGRVTSDHLRGRAHHSPLAQVAEVAARRALAVEEIDAVTVTDEPVITPQPGGGAVQVIAEAAGHHVQVAITSHRDQPRPMSCGAEAESPTRLEVDSVEVLG